MAFADMQSELRGSVPKFPITFAPTLINRAWKRIRESHLWSFNMLEFAWASPAVVTSGTATVTQGSTNVTFDANAIAALNASVATTPTSLITQRQLRVGSSGIYNIIAYNSVSGAAILDRPWFDLSGVTVGYQVYQVYYAAPVSDFLILISVRNPQMFLDFDLTKTREWLDRNDPQRFQYTWPAYAVPYMKDTRGAGTVNASSTLGFQLYELWGQPVQQFTYQCYGVRSGLDLINPGDTLPFFPVPDGEDMIMARAKYWSYEWAATQVSTSPRNSGPDWKFLMGATMDEYRDMLRTYRKQDKEFLNNYRILNVPAVKARVLGHYNTLAGTAGSDY
jgi:hypothetical protein